MDFALLNALASLERPDGLIALPGPDSYVLAVRPDHPEALVRLHRVKGAAEPLLLLGRDRNAFTPYLAPLPAAAEVLMNRFWPGPLVLMLDKQETLGEAFSPQRQVKVLQPDNPLVLDFLSLTPGGLLATLCASRLVDPPARTARQVHDSFGEDVDLVLANDRDLLESGAPTVVSVQGDGAIHLLRSGSVVLD